MHWFRDSKKIIAYLILTLPILAVQYAFPRTDFYLFITCFTLSFISYFFLLKKKLQPDFKLGLVVRMALLFGLPTLSDDFYRFYWDGLLMVKGINPYDYLPENIPYQFEEKSVLLAQMNSPQYYSPYTPVLQLLFAFCAWVGGSLFGFLIVFRLFILLAEILIFFMLKKLITQSWKLNIWWLNPLVILEFTANLHQEIFVVLGITGFFYFQYKKEYLSVSAYVLAVLTKLIPLIYLPAFFRVFSFKVLLLSQSLN